MYICKDCKSIFENPKEYSEDRTPGGSFEGSSFIYKYYACPYCEGSYEIARECYMCGKYFKENLMKKIDDVFICDKCITD